MEVSRCATYVLLIHLSLPLSCVLVKANFKSMGEVSKFRVNSLSIVYRCAIYNLSTLRGPVSTNMGEGPHKKVG